MLPIWILTEEKPKLSTVARILELVAHLEYGSLDEQQLLISPILDASMSFTFVYQVEGCQDFIAESVYLTIVSGYSSFVDYLVYRSEGPPDPQEEPLFAIEETKTDDSESRNTSVYQRATKFVYLPFFYRECSMVMLYNFQVQEKLQSTDTNVFGSRCLRTLNVDIVGKNSSPVDSFENLQEFVEVKNRMKRPPTGNTPLTITMSEFELAISAKLEKSGRFENDPNIGASSLFAAVSRKLGWRGRITITNHGLTQQMVGKNKWVKLAGPLGMQLEGLTIPDAALPSRYWRYEGSGEKVGTIFLHTVLDLRGRSQVIYDNHAGCERGYFWTQEGKPLALPKQIKAVDASGRKRKFPLPDLVFVDPDRRVVVSLEGEKSENYAAGESQIQDFGVVEDMYIRPHYRDFEFERWVTTYGDSDRPGSKLVFELGSSGEIRTQENCPKAILEALDYLRSRPASQAAVAKARLLASKT